MILKLNPKQYEFLNSTLGIEKPKLFNSLLNMSGVGIELSDDVAIEIGDWIGEKLQQEGFDENYNLTATGKVLEEVRRSFPFLKKRNKKPPR